MSTPLADGGASLGAPPISRRDVVLVTGPPLAGTTAVATALRHRLAELTVVEADELDEGEAPAAVVFVASATAPLTESDRALLDAATGWTDAVIGVVSKTDVHRTWRAVLQANRTTLATARHADMPWVGVAAAPDIGAPAIDQLIDALLVMLADPSLERRNRLRARKSQLIAVRARQQSAAANRDGLLAELCAQRAAVLRRRQLDKSRQSIALRANTQQARLQLCSLVRNRCASVRAELQCDAAVTTRRRRAGFVGTVRDRLPALLDEVDAAVTTRLAAAAVDLGLPAVDVAVPPVPAVDVAGPPLRPRVLETRLMALLGAGFGLGVALTLTRLLAEFTPGPATAFGCAALGVGLTLWVVGTRGLLQDRAMLDRWVAEVVATLRTTLEERVVARVLGAESAFGGALAERDVAAGARVRQEIADLDGQIGERRAVQARAVAARDRQLPAIDRALSTVNAELGRLRAGQGRRNRPGRSSESFL